MSHNFLITGGSGYLGGTLLAQLKEANLPPYGTGYALVRSDSQAAAVRNFDLEPLQFDARDAAAVEDNVTKLGITIVFWLIDAASSTAQCHFINALAKVRQKTGLDVHLLHTTGAKVFSGFTGTVNDRPVYDNDPELYKLQSSLKCPMAVMQPGVDANTTIVAEAEAKGVRSYIFIPCIVYGRGRGFGNPISIQTVAIVKAAKAARGVYRVGSDNGSWPVCDVEDTAALYLDLLKSILAGRSPSYGPQGHYLASSGHVAWEDLYSAFAKALVDRQVIDDASVRTADEEVLRKMSEGLQCPPDLVQLQLGGRCSLVAKNGETVGWKPKRLPEHIIEYAAEEVRLVLENI
ncbi:hypothetical protein HIM_01074 [Hirsutella minnesotensis 3608]|nr:hypothetical protein HIM_01074 [Hirsutella minnesotensis 3608]